MENIATQSPQAGKQRWFQAGQAADKPCLSVEDVIGPEQSEKNIPELQRAMEDLRKQVGLGKVKDEI